MENIQDKFDLWCLVKEDQVEVWLPIQGFEAMYEVSSFGNVRSLERKAVDTTGRIQKLKPRILAPLPNKEYLCVQLWKNNEMNRLLIHRLVAAAIYGECPEGKIVNHKDGNKLNNHGVNLEYTDYTGNIEHAYANHLRKSGEKHIWAKYSDELINRIRARHNEGLGCRKLAKEFSISKNSIVNIINNKTRKHQNHIQNGHSIMGFE